MEQVIVGPPGYGSPDPRTVVGRLVTLDEHPDRENIADDYGSDVTVEEIALTFPEGVGPNAPKTREELEDMKKAELVTLAEAKGVEDASSMKKDELVDALADDNENS
jgi:hypothetical protein